MKIRVLASAIALPLAMGAAVILANMAGADAAITAMPAQTTQFRVNYTGSLFIFPVGELSVVGNVTPGSYAMRADMQTSGFGKFTKDGGLWSTSTGFYAEEGFRPIEHIIQKLNKKARRVAMTYDAEGNPTSVIEPRFGSMGVPAASDAERREAVDAMAAILKLMMTGHTYGEQPCQGVIPVFDGKQRYDLRLEPAGTKTIRQSSYSGKTTRCHIYMETVSGYDPEDLLTEEEASTPVEVYLANFEDAGLYVPVRFDYRISGIKVNIKANYIDVKAG